MRVVDVLLALPGLLLALAIVTAIGFGTLPVAVAVGAGIVPGFARTARAEVMRVKTLPYVEAARLGERVGRAPCCDTFCRTPGARWQCWPPWTSARRFWRPPA